MFPQPVSSSAARRRLGFTLLELLTVIAIVGILAAILIPVIGQALESARTAACSSNLRQLGMGIQLYTTDHKGMLPGGTNPFPDWSGATPWNGIIKPYLVPDQNSGWGWGGGQVFQCPSCTITPANPDGTTYGANPLAMMDIMWGGGWRVSYNSIRNPTKLILLMDAAQWPDGGVGVTLYDIPNVGSGSLTAPMQQGADSDGVNPQRTYRFRHGSNKANFLYADGSVRTQTWSDLTRDNFAP